MFIKYKNKNLYDSLSAYGIGFHRHNSEIEQMIKKYTKKKFKFSFTPHLSPMFRGILITIYLDLNKIFQNKQYSNDLKKNFIQIKFCKNITI